MTEHERQIIQLADYMNMLKIHLRNLDRLDLTAAACLNWQAIIKDKNLINTINNLNSYFDGEKRCS
jgi:hypothetical protein